MTTRRTVVRNHGNMNKGGSKTIFTYGSDGSLKSTKNLRGSLGNKRGGSDNQYTITTNNIPQANGSASNSTSFKKSSETDLGLVGALLMLGFGGVVLAILAVFSFISYIANAIASILMYVLNSMGSLILTLFNMLF